MQRLFFAALAQNWWDLLQCVFQAVLSSIVFVNLKGMFKQHADVVTLWKSSKIDLVRGQSSEGRLWFSIIILHAPCFPGGVDRHVGVDPAL